MPYYVKCSPQVAADLGLTADRNRLPDGNYLLWQADLGPAHSLKREAARLGCLLLTTEQARAEQRGGTPVPLPCQTPQEGTPTDTAAPEVTPDNGTEAEEEEGGDK